MITFLLVIIVALLLMLVSFKITELVGKINNDDVIMPERKPKTPIVPPGAQGFRLLDDDDSPCPIERPGSQGRPPHGGSNVTTQNCDDCSKCFNYEDCRCPNWKEKKHE